MRYRTDRYMRHILVLLSVLAIQNPSPCLSLDAPHTNIPGYNIECGTCHWVHKGPVPPWGTLPNLPDAADNTLNNRRCYACHDGSMAGVPMVKTHSASATSSAYWSAMGGWTTECVICHDPHQQRQTRVWGASTHLATGAPPASIGSWDTSTNSTQITVVGTIADNYYGYYFMPDKNNNYFYEIVSDTTNTDTFQVKGGVWSSFVQSGGYAIVYGKNVRESISYINPGGQTVGGAVKLFRPSGDYGPGDSANTMTSVCYVCHRLTLHWSTSGDTAHNDRTDCTSCHLHTWGFKASCNSCHGNPPVVDTLGGPDGLVSTPAPTGSSSAGSHTKHATPASMNYACNTCHYGGMPASPVDGNNRLQIGFNILGLGGGLYDGQTLSAPYSYEGTNGTAITTGGSLTCSNIYCHSDGTSVSTGTIPDNTSPTWGSGAIACDTCHGFSPDYANGTPKANSHSQHAYACNKCHSTTTNDGVTVTDKTVHVNGAYNLNPGTGISFSYSFASSGGTCTAISCHGNGTAVWGGALACDECHDCPPDTASHLKHYGGTLSQAGYGDTRIAQDFSANATAYIINCGNCHPLDPARHGNGAIEVELYNVLAPAGSIKVLNWSSAAYSSGSTVLTDSRGFPYTQGTCNGVYCHSYTDWKTPLGVPSPWTTDTLPPNIEITRIYRNVTWGSPSLTCSGCHANPPRTSYPANDGGTGNSHSWIDSYGYDNLHSWNMSFDPISCSYCHYDTVNQLNTWTRSSEVTTYGDVPISNFSKHVNGVNDVALDRSKPFIYPTFSFGNVAMWLTNATYDPASKTCSNVSCHIDQTRVKWGLPYRWDTAECYRCHDSYY